MARVKPEQTKTVPKTFIRISWEEHNLKTLLKVLNEYKLKINRASAYNPNPDAWKRTTKDNIPVTWTHIELENTYQEVCKAIKSSIEFRKHVNKIMWTV